MVMGSARSACSHRQRKSLGRGKDVLTAIRDVNTYECEHCGSEGSLWLDGSVDDVSRGMFTVNFVAHFTKACNDMQ